MNKEVFSHTFTGKIRCVVVDGEVFVPMKLPAPAEQRKPPMTCHDYDDCHPTSEPCEKCPKPAAPTSFWERLEETFLRDWPVPLMAVENWVKRELKEKLKSLRVDKVNKKESTSFAIQGYNVAVDEFNERLDKLEKDLEL